MPPRSRPRRRALAVAIAAAVAVALGGCAGAVDNREHPKPASATLPHRGPERPGAGLPPHEPGAGLPPAHEPGAGFAPTPAAGSFDAPGVPPLAPGFEVGELPERLNASGPASPPVRLVIPAIGVATPLVRLGLLAGGGMAVPGDFGRAGWFAGHVDSQRGPAVFYRLRELRPGQAVLVERADGRRLRFVVEQARSYPKDGFPTDAVFGPVPAAALRLITCAGDFDRARGSYRDNLVVFARLAGTG